MRPIFAALALAAVAFALAPPAQAVQFKHIVIIMQENRTPDNLFGSNPTFESGVDIGTSGVNSLGHVIPLTPLALSYCYDIDHSHVGFENTLTLGSDQDALQIKAGCVVPANPQFKYADNSTGQVQPYFDIATNYGFGNRMFQTNQGPSFPAHQFIFGGTSQPSTDSPLFAAGNPLSTKEFAGCIAPADQTVALIDGTGSTTTNAPTYPCYEHPTMGDVLDTAGLTWHYYAQSPGGLWDAPNAIQHICVPATVSGKLKCTGPHWANGDVSPYSPPQFITDVQNCNLPSLTWVTPTPASSDHSVVTDGTGPAWVGTLVNTIGQQATCANGDNYWQDTAIIITWDDWGGWYDHVAPFKVKADQGSKVQWGDGYTYGFRVPLLVVSAYTKMGYVNQANQDFGSILRFVEQNFGLPFIGPNNSIYSNYADYQAASRQVTLSPFFALTKPRAFVPIAVTVPASPLRTKQSAAAYFLHQRATDVPVDDD